MDAQTYFHSMVSANVYDDFVYDLTFVKLRELSLGYKLPYKNGATLVSIFNSATINWLPAIHG
jgi:hypothetical protein